MTRPPPSTIKIARLEHIYRYSWGANYVPVDGRLIFWRPEVVSGRAAPPANRRKRNTRISEHPTRPVLSRATPGSLRAIYYSNNNRCVTAGIKKQTIKSKMDWGGRPPAREGRNRRETLQSCNIEISREKNLLHTFFIQQDLQETRERKRHIVMTRSANNGFPEMERMG